MAGSRRRPSSQSRVRPGLAARAFAERQREAATSLLRCVPQPTPTRDPVLSTRIPCRVGSTQGISFSPRVTGTAKTGLTARLQVALQLPRPLQRDESDPRLVLHQAPETHVWPDMGHGCRTAQPRLIRDEELRGEENRICGFLDSVLKLFLRPQLHKCLHDPVSGLPHARRPRPRSP